MFYRRLMKLLHEIGAIGLMGAIATMLVLAWHAPAPEESLVQYATARHGIAMVSKYVLVPSLALVLVSGLVAIIVNDHFINAGWVWAKAATGVLMFEGTLVTIAASARKAAELSAMAVAGTPDPVRLAEVLRS